MKEYLRTVGVSETAHQFDDRNRICHVKFFMWHSGHHPNDTARESYEIQKIYNSRRIELTVPPAPMRICAILGTSTLLGLLICPAKDHYRLYGSISLNEPSAQGFEKTYRFLSFAVVYIKVFNTYLRLVWNFRPSFLEIGGFQAAGG